MAESKKNSDSMISVIGRVYTIRERRIGSVRNYLIETPNTSITFDVEQFDRLARGQDAHDINEHAFIATEGLAALLYRFLSTTAKDKTQRRASFVSNNEVTSQG